MEFPMMTVDAFTINETPFTGNPAAICILNYDSEISDENKQKIASEMNLSETAFVAKAWNKDSKQNENTFTLRWFTPNTEIELCGHATLAAANATFNSLVKNSTNSIKFQTKFNGAFEVVFNSNTGLIAFDFPLNDCIPMDQKANPWIEDIIRYTLGPKLTTNDVIDVQLSTRLKYLLIRLKDGEDLIEKVSSNSDQLLRIQTNNSVKLVIVTQRPSDLNTYQFKARHFAPWFGVTEDPVCGSAHTVLAPYWKRQYEKSGLHFQELIGKQCSKRGGIVNCKIINDRVQLSGRTRIVIKGFLQI